MCIYKYGSVVSLVSLYTGVYFYGSTVRGCNSVSPQAMSFEAHSLTVPSVMWLGLLPSDLQRFGLNLSYFLHPPTPNWNDRIFQGIVCFGFSCCCPVFFPFVERHLRPY